MYVYYIYICSYAVEFESCFLQMLGELTNVCRTNRKEAIVVQMGAYVFCGVLDTS